VTCESGTCKADPDKATAFLPPTQPDIAPTQLAGGLVAATTAALRGERDANELLAALLSLRAQQTPLNGYIDALIAVLSNEPHSALTLLNRRALEMVRGACAG